MLDLGQKILYDGSVPKDKPGFRLTDQALVNAAWQLENTFAQGVSGGKLRMYAALRLG